MIALLVLTPSTDEEKILLRDGPAIRNADGGGPIIFLPFAMEGCLEQRDPSSFQWATPHVTSCALMLGRLVADQTA